MEKNNGFLHMWSVYDHPKDQPNHFVARLWLIGDGKLIPTNDMFIADTLEEVRSLLPPGLVCVPRDPGDDPVILETWF
jgi:hypothetical protein